MSMTPYQLKVSEAVKRHLAKFGDSLPPGPPSRSVAESWQRISAWLAEHAPKFYWRPYEGASADQIAAAEATFGMKLPEDFKQSVQLHDGGPSDPICAGDLLRLDQIIEQWKMYRSWQEEGTYASPDSSDWEPREMEGPIKPVFWNLKRIPITDNSGDHLMLDLDPPESGDYGQILDHTHDDGPTRVLARSWADFLAKLVSDLEAGKFVYIEDNGDSDVKPLEELQRLYGTGETV